MCTSTCGLESSSLITISWDISTLLFGGKGHLFKNVCAWIYSEHLKENYIHEWVIMKILEYLRYPENFSNYYFLKIINEKVMFVERIF